jgi:hypothetical protein
MKIKIIDNPKSYLRARVTCGSSPSSDEYANALDSVAGQWIQVSTDNLFATSFNGIIDGKTYHIEASLVADIKDDARIGYPWVFVNDQKIVCYTPQALEGMVRDRRLTEVMVEYMSFADNRIHQTRLIVQNNFTFDEIQAGVLNSDRSATEYTEETVSPAIDKIILDF